MSSVLLFFGLTSYIFGKAHSVSSSNEYDTYNANECQRIRQPWHKLTSEERDLYISGLLQIRQNGNGNITEDELVSIASVHEDPLAFIHQTSSYLFWHGYLIWELESRIRNLGGKYKCFGMPYWDFTLESGREDDPTIFEQDIGGNGDSNNYWTVNKYSWYPTIEQYWVPYNCKGKHDLYPLCSLKRILNVDFAMPTAQEIGNSIINNPNFVDFADYSHISGSAIHLIDAHPDDMENIPDFPQAYEPIWYLFHSAIQFHQALWIDCNDYDLIDVNDLDNYPDAFTPFCNSYNGCDNDKYAQDRGNLNGIKWSLDDVMEFGGSLGEQKWSYIYNNDLSVRKLYMLPKWNIIYDLDNGKGFYTDSGLADYCKGKLNKNWFIIDGLNTDNINADQNVIDVGGYLSSFAHNWIMIGFIIVSVAFIMFYLFRAQNKTVQNILNPKEISTHSNYGAV